MAFDAPLTVYEDPAVAALIAADLALPDEPAEPVWSDADEDRAKRLECGRGWAS